MSSAVGGFPAYESLLTDYSYLITFFHITFYCSLLTAPLLLFTNPCSLLSAFP